MMKLTKLKFIFIFSIVISHFACADETLGIALALKGEVLVTRGIIEFEAKTEENFYFEDEIETGDDGFVQISFYSSFLSVGPNTILSFTTEVNDKGEELIKVNLEDGKFRSQINGLQENQIFEVHTEKGFLRVHGTDFVVSYDSEKEDNVGVSVIEGLVSIDESRDNEDKDNGVAKDNSWQKNLIAMKKGYEPDDDNDDLDITGKDPVFVKKNQVTSFFRSNRYTTKELPLNEADELKKALPIPGDGKEDYFYGMEVAQVALVLNQELELSHEKTQPEFISAPESTGVSQSRTGFQINFTVDTVK